jgi:hypothetical protein
VDAVRLEPVREARADARAAEAPAHAAVLVHPVRSYTKMSCMVMTSPSIPTISETAISWRLPSGRRLAWITTSMALAICWRMARSGRFRFAIEDHRLQAG